MTFNTPFTWHIHVVDFLRASSFQFLCGVLTLLSLLSLGSGVLRGAETGPDVPPAEPERVLMGYSRLDGAGLPTEVRVALSRAQFTALWSLAHPTPSVPSPIVDLATGVPRWHLAARTDGATTLDAELRLPVAVLVDAWRQVRLPVPAGSVNSVRVEALASDGVAPSADQLVWQGAAGDAADTVVFSIAGRTQATVVVRMTLPLRQDGGQWSVALPMLPGSGGTLELLAATGWEPLSPQAAFTVSASKGGNMYTANLPTQGDHLDLRLRRIDAAAPREVHLSLAQDLSVALLIDRLQWAGDLNFTIQGGTLRELRVMLPDSVVLGTVESPGLASWRQTGGVLDLAWSAPVTGAVRVHLSGVISRSAGSKEAGPDIRGTVAVAVDCAGAERVQGRLGLLARDASNADTTNSQRDERLTVSELATVTRAEPRAGEDLAVQWSERTPALRVSWEPLANDQRATLHAALAVDAQWVRVAARLRLSGRGVVDDVRLALPPPWRVLHVIATGTSGAAGTNGAANTTVDASLVGAGADRVLLLRSAEPLGADRELQIWLAADRVELGEGFALPDLWLVNQGSLAMQMLLKQGPAKGLQLERQQWLIGDDGDRRLVVDTAAHISPAPAALLSAEFAPLLKLPPGFTWRQAIERRSGSPAHLTLQREAPRQTMTASHYLVLEADRLRWSARLVFTPVQGELHELVCQLPPGARLVRSAGRDLGSLVVTEQGVLTARLTAPAREATTLDLDLELAVSDGAPLRISAIMPGASSGAGAAAGAPGDVLIRQQVALVEDYELGLVHRTLEGLVEQAELTLPLPAEVDATQVKLRWSAQRPDWSLTLRREPLVPAGGLDGIATMVDAYGAIAPDGEVRGRATWHVLNRSRQQMRLSLPPGLDLWEVRVDGRQASCRRDATDSAVVWVPVRPLRTGEAARRIELTWRQAAAGGASTSSTALHPLMPMFSELKIMQVLWRFAPPPGWTVTRQEGALKTIATTDADGERAKRVVEELTRLRGQGELKDNALLRCNAQLDQLELELNDYLVQLNSSSLPQVHVQAKEVAGQINQLQNDRSMNSSVYGSRTSNRKALGIGKRTRDWSPSSSINNNDTTPEVLTLPTDLPWREALCVNRIDPRTGLGDGTPPPGHRAAGGRTLLGIDLVGDTPVGLTVRGLGGDTSIELSVTRPAPAQWPFFSSLGATLALALSALALHRRR